jgi:DNA topoisomerase-1
MKAWNWAKKDWSASLLICVPIRPGSPEAIQEVREYIGKEYGRSTCPSLPIHIRRRKKRRRRTKRFVRRRRMRHPDQMKQYLKEDEFKVYKLIWQRFVASQINPAVFDQTTVDIDAKNRERDVSGSA